MQIIHKLRLAVANMRRTHESGTYSWHLGQDNKGNDWAIVLGWRDGFDADEVDDCADGTYRLCTKLAYQPSNSLMQCDYDVDWMMPYDEDTGEVDVTEFVITPTTNLEAELKWLLDIWKERYDCENRRNRLSCAS